VQGNGNLRLSHGRIIYHTRTPAQGTERLLPLELACCVLRTICANHGPCGILEWVAHNDVASQCASNVGPRVEFNEESLKACESGQGVPVNKAILYQCAAFSSSVFLE